MSVLDRIGDVIRNHRALVVLALGLIVVTVGVEAIGGTLLGRILIAFYINLMVVLALQLFTGNSGLLSFAHVGFMGIGAYLSAVLTMTPEAKGFAIPDLYPFLETVTLPFIPAVLIAGMFGFTKREFFDAEPEASAVPNVDLSLS